ncbi:unnamed protein product [Arctia plantaginis]|uniref:Uncharacterized protein n=1 Tax=Arctia plantaginis TaxID=874455 RepID=A0A8S1B1R3_ARCPL|nr:unnamed protein product [Arctia plantaginis]
MEAVEEPPLNISKAETMKVCVISDEAKEITVASAETDVCQKSNGVADSSKSKEEPTLESKTVIAQEKIIKSINKMDNMQNITKEDTVLKPATSSTETGTTPDQKVESGLEVEDISTTEKSSDINEEPSMDVETEKNIYPVDEKELVIESTVDQVTFQTEILVESNDTDVIETVCDSTKIEEQETNNILSELGTGIELSEALRSSDVTDNVENNNCSGRQEVFNKEELLDILEGNDDEQCDSLLSSGYPPISGEKILETQLALQQLSRLKTKPKKPKSIERFPRKKKQRIVAQNTTHIPEVKDENNIVKVLVKEWDDEEGAEVDKSNKVVEENNDLSQSSSDALNLQESVSKQDDVRTSIDSQTADGNTPGLNKSGDETQPQRRLGRVIKKKVIFDPDNPDTYTKSKVISKGKDHMQEKDQTQFKKIKTEPTFQRSKSKSPLSKLQWKKPSPKNIKQNKRLTEVDKLLMDEGAVNMIYQLTPEAPKGKKNMKTKAEFIKKIQSSSTPDIKEMKFRERKKESKYEDSEARRILGGKQRPSLSSSVKSHCVSEDFEAHSADDSIIYRRHSSSSYSSSCMSPRRLSDVEMTGQISRKSQSLVNHEVNNDNQTVDMFMPDSEEVVKMEIINKNDCLSIKQKLNSKLNLALKKRKRDNSKTDKPPKQKKVMQTVENTADIEEFKYLSIDIDGKLALICVQKSGPTSNVEMIRELEKAFKVINNLKDVSVTLLLPECGSTYSDLDLKTLLEDNSEKRTSYAYKMADSIRILLQTVKQHSKLLCTGASGRCSGVLLALIGLSDVALASERASFAVSMKSQSAGLIEPGISVLTSYRHLPESVLNDMIVFGRRMSASDALQNGLPK